MDKDHASMEAPRIPGVNAIHSASAHVTTLKSSVIIPAWVIVIPGIILIAMLYQLFRRLMQQ